MNIKTEFGETIHIGLCISTVNFSCTLSLSLKKNYVIVYQMMVFKFTINILFSTIVQINKVHTL